jgi:hypothetical protein
LRLGILDAEAGVVMVRGNLSEKLRLLVTTAGTEEEIEVTIVRPQGWRQRVERPFARGVFVWVSLDQVESCASIVEPYACCSRGKARADSCEVGLDQ